MTYQYKRLNHDNAARPIRVLDILPGNGNVQAELRQVSLKDAPVFEALSYCWGTPENRNHIILDGQRFPVTANLYSALKQLRTPDLLRTLWIDAICINQNDFDEKNIQVALMRDIYQASQRVLIWLGKEDRQTGKAYDIIRVMASWLKRKQSGSVDERQNIDMCLLSDPRTAKINRRNAWDILSIVFQRPWFTRVWIIQEVSTAYQGLMICGKHQVDWDDVESLLYLNWGLVTGTLQNLINQRREWRRGAISTLRPKFLDVHFESKIKQDLISLVVRHFEARATNPRDKIFALIGLIQEPTYQVAVDYNIDIDALFSNITQLYVQKTQNLDILSFACGDAVGRPVDVPSWTLNSRYSVTNHPRPTVTFSWASKVHSIAIQFDASRGSKHQCQSSGNATLLQVEGFVVDTLAVVGDCLNWSPATKDTSPSLDMWRGVLQASKCFNNWMDMCQDRSTYKSSIKNAVMYPDIREVFRTICHGTYPIERSDPQLSKAHFENFDSIMSVYRRFCRFQGHDISAFYNVAQLFTLCGQLISTKFADAVQRWPNDTESSLHRRFVRTREGRMGLVPRQAKVGDAIAIMRGASVPFVLRRSENSDRWKLVGESYIHSIMFGEGWDEMACETMMIE